MVIKDDAVSTADLSSELANFSGLSGASTLYSTDLTDGTLSIIYLLRDKDDVADHHLAKREHARKLFLNQLELCDFFAELFSL